ncbi:MAG: ABC transporter permease, partial [Acetobacteraceae bacterium]|nr:ABC transporter permease [Acetobacteraceae bacterium]
RGRASAADFSFGTSIDGLAMVLLGGVQSMSGPIAGAFAGTALRTAVQSAGQAWHLTLGVVLIAVALWVPQGVAGATLRFWCRAL